MGQLEDMALFVRIVEAGSLTKAADQLNIAKSAVSRRLGQLETQLNNQLINRTTRTSTLTAAGEQFYREANQILEAVKALNDTINQSNTDLQGTLTLSAPLSFGLMHLNDVIDKYASAHPNLNFKLDFSDRQVDLIEEGYEMAVRIGDLQDSSYQARRFATIRYVLCASPNYLNLHGTPTSPTELIEHQFLQYGFNSKNNEILITDAEGQQTSIRVSAKIKANNGDFLLNMAIKGHGIAFLPTFIAYQAVVSGQLIRLLPSHTLPTVSAYAVYPKNRFLSKRCRLLIDLLTVEFGESPYWDKAISKG